MSQRTSGTCGLFSRAEDKLKLSDDVIEEVSTWFASVVDQGKSLIFQENFS